MSPLRFFSLSAIVEDKIRQHQYHKTVREEIDAHFRQKYQSDNAQRRQKVCPHLTMTAFFSFSWQSVHLTMRR